MPWGAGPRRVRLHVPNLRGALSLSNGDRSTLVGSPITIGLWVMVLVSLTLPALLRRRQRADVTVVEKTAPRVAEPER